MTIRDDKTGIEITLGYDDEGFPYVCIYTNGSYYNELNRPNMAVAINGVVVHEMFGDLTDKRWNQD